MSRVLFLARELPHPPNAGDRVVTYGFLRALERRGHEIHVLGYGRSDDDPAADALRSFCASVDRVPSSKSGLPPALRKAARTATGRSDVMAMFHSTAFRDAAANWIRELTPDVVVAQHPYVGQFFLDGRVEDALAATGADPVTSAHVVEYAAHQRRRQHATDVRTQLALAAEIPRLRAEELAVYERSAATLVLGREDQAELEERVSGPVHRQRVGLDADSYETADSRHWSDESAADRGGEPAANRADGGRQNQLLFFGSYDWFPNADAARYLCERVFPRVREIDPDAELLLAGRGAGDDIAAYGDDEGVTFLGEVDDLAELVRAASVVVAPLRVGGGTRIKVLESMAWGAPVVTTPAGREGVEATAGEDICVADGVEEFATKTARLLDQPEERARLAANGREVVERRYSIDAVGESLERHLGLVNR